MAEKYFLGVMTDGGFSTQIGEFVQGREFFTYILKGGPGTGKSTLMETIARRFEPEQRVVRYYCSSDPGSLDAVVLMGSKIAVIDGTAPHTFDPAYPGCCQRIVDLGQCWEQDKLSRNLDNIVSVTDKNKSLHDRVKRFCKALSNVCADTKNCAESCIDREWLERYLCRTADRLMPQKSQTPGKRTIRQLAALTEHGYYLQSETLDSYSNIYALKDDLFASSQAAVGMLADLACQRGYDVVLCPSHAFNNSEFEHLLIPELGLAFLSTSFLAQPIPQAKRLELGRSYKKEWLIPLRNRLKMDRITIKQLSEEIYSTIAEAKRIHDDIERYYIEAMDKEKLNSVAAGLIAEIEQKS